MSRINLTVNIGPSALLTDQYACSIKLEYRYALHESCSSLRAAAGDFGPVSALNSSIAESQR